MKTFEVNEYLKLKLEDNKTNIYVGKEKFNQCKFLLLKIDINHLTELADLDCVDEAAELLDTKMERSIETEINIPPDTEFWAHCSNLQVWYENNYDTRLIHRNLAFPLLKKLTEIGDPLAKKVFKKEIGKRLESKSQTVIHYLTQEKYTEYLTYEELKSCLYDLQERFLKWWNENLNIQQTSLYLNDLCIFELPDSIGDLKDLRTLDLEVNNLRELPESLCNLELLNKLNISFNNLKKLPDNIGNLKNLKSLKANLNQITSLPRSFTNLYSLQELKMSKNQIENFPPSLTNLKSLQNLDLSLNNISKIPSSFCRLKSLEMLNLSYNKLEYLPKDFGNLTRLKFIDLRNNSIKELPDSITNLDSIEYIYLNNNQINQVPKNMKHLNNVKVINLLNNNITEVPKSFKDFNRLILK